MSRDLRRNLSFAASAVSGQDSAAQLPRQDFAHQRGVRLAFAGLHHLALEKIQRGGLAGFEVGGAAEVRPDNIFAEITPAGDAS